MCCGREWRAAYSNQDVPRADTDSAPPGTRTASTQSSWRSVSPSTGRIALRLQQIKRRVQILMLI